MKKTLLLFLGLTVGITAEAQEQKVKTPAPSPKAVINQTVGLTNFEITYSRPSLRGRDMHKELVPFGEVWRFGANENTTITFDTDVKIGSVNVKPGTYSIFATPDTEAWSIVLYSEVNNWGTPKELKKKSIVAEVKAPIKKLNDKVETFTIAFNDLQTNEFNLQISWENIMLTVPVEIPTAKLTESSIKEVIEGGEASQIDYFRAASYYALENTNLEDALSYADKAIEMQGDKVPAYYIYNKAVILQKLGKKEEAIKTANQCIEVAKKQNFESYVVRGEKLIEELKN
ncbi:MAG TPA: DUF2911 domain-containing protein [Brumimicrobium sp.]|nr:DUF2911 domain-containing protein [Brumimicrobium sp.]